MTADEAGNMAESNFRGGLNCSQSVVAVFADELHFDADTLLRAASPFGGGTCRMREMCGAVTGALMCLGMAMGAPDGDKAKRDALYQAGQELAARFRRDNGSVICRELLGLVPMGQSEKLAQAGQADTHQADAPTSAARTAEYYAKRPCPAKCASAARLLQEMLLEMQVANSNDSLVPNFGAS